MKIIVLTFASMITFASAASAQYYDEKWHPHHHERYFETVCKQEFRGLDGYGRPIYREVCWQEERWR
jgi:hypothetical protein